MSYQTVEEYIASLQPWQMEIVARLRALLKQVEPPAIERIMWNQPVFDVNGHCCYIKAFQDHVNFGFFRGAALSDPAGLLHGSGEMMRHIPIKNAAEITENLNALTDMIYEAMRLNLEEGDPTLQD
jgi:hypothetical protein